MTFPKLVYMGQEIVEGLEGVRARFIAETCPQCLHPWADHLPEEHGCTVASCSCAQVPDR